MEMINPPATVELQSGKIEGKSVRKTVRQLRHMQGYYKDTEAFKKLNPYTPTYEVAIHEADGTEGKEGALSFGTTFLYPGKVGCEYFMTKGHFHEKRDRAEYYWGIQGEGALVLMDEQGGGKVEKVYPGSLHYIGANIAHRLVNTGPAMLSVGACWNADAGHEYGEILEKGFTVRVIEEEGKPVVKNC